MNDVILLHGALGCSGQLRTLGTLLTERGRKVHYLNFSGHGKQDRSAGGFGIPVFSDELLAFIQKNKLSGPAVFGYSMGGYVALKLESMNPGTLSAVMTLGTKFKWNPGIAEKEIGNLDPAIIESKVPKFAAMLQNMHGDGWKELLATTAQMMREMGEKNFLNEKELKSIRIPVLLCLAENDQMVSRTETEEVLTCIQNAQGIHYFKGKHPIETVDAQSIAEIFLRFIP